MTETRSNTFKCPQKSVNFLGSNIETEKEFPCLLTILSLSASKIQYQFTRNIFLLPYLSNCYLQIFLVKLKKLNLINKFSLLENGFSISELINSSICYVEPPIFTSELSDRKVNMQNNEYNRVIKNEESNVLTLDSLITHSNSLTNAQWAKQFIRTNGISHLNFKTHIEYINLPKSPRKRAVYDQLNLKRKKELQNESEKLCSSKKSIEIDNKKIGWGELSISSLKFITAILIEKLILSRSFLFFTSLNFTVQDSWLTAIIIELCYMITSAIKGKYALFLNILIYIYSAFTICFSSYVNDSAIKNFDKDQTIKLAQIRKKLEREHQVWKNNNKERIDILHASERFTGLGELSKGKAVLSDRRKALKASEKLNKATIEELETRLETLTSKTLNKTEFSKENLKLLSSKTIATMSMFLLIQILSAYFTRSFFRTITTYINQNKELQKRQPKKR